jgi:hypothetical protein
LRRSALVKCHQVGQRLFSAVSAKPTRPAVQDFLPASLEENLKSQRSQRKSADIAEKDERTTRAGVNERRLYPASVKG